MSSLLAPTASSSSSSAMPKDKAEAQEESVDKQIAACGAPKSPIILHDVILYKIT